MRTTILNNGTGNFTCTSQIPRVAEGKEVAVLKYASNFGPPQRHLGNPSSLLRRKEFKQRGEGLHFRTRSFHVIIKYRIWPQIQRVF